MFTAPSADRQSAFTLPSAATRPHIPGGWRYKGITETGEPVTWYGYDVGVWIFTKRSIAEYALAREVR